ncbi:MAG: hypothetical protein ACTSWW_05985 [Promethearchaeota archaeon]
MGVLVGLNALIQTGQFFLPFILSSVLSWVGFFIAFSVKFVFQWGMVVLNDQGIKFRALGKKHDKGFVWRDILKLEITYEIRTRKTYNEEAGSGTSHSPILVVDVFLIEGGKQSIDIEVDDALFSYTKRLKDAKKKKLVNEWVQNQTNAILVKPEIEKFKPRSQKKFRYTWEFERSQ